MLHLVRCSVGAFVHLSNDRLQLELLVGSEQLVACMPIGTEGT